MRLRRTEKRKPAITDVVIIMILAILMFCFKLSILQRLIQSDAADDERAMVLFSTRLVSILLL